MMLLTQAIHVLSDTITHPAGQKDTFQCTNLHCSAPPVHQGAYLCFDIVVLVWQKKKKSEEEKSPQLRKMADVEMDIASTRMNNGNEHV